VQKLLQIIFQITPVYYFFGPHHFYVLHPYTGSQKHTHYLHTLWNDQRLLRDRSLLSPPRLSSRRRLGGGWGEAALSLLLPLLDGLDGSDFGDFVCEIRLVDPCILGGSSTAVPVSTTNYP